MNPEYPTQPPADPTDDIKNPIASMQPGEKNICEIKRHPIGMLGTYIMSGFVLVVVAVLALIVAPHVITSQSSGKVTTIGVLIFLIVAIFTSLFVFIANKVYWGNRWVLTTDSLTQITQNSLFDKQSSQLSLGNLEDVTAEQNGILTHMFKYGVLRVETAGERSKFMFLYCPNPDDYAKQILSAREAFEVAIHQAGGVNQGSYGVAPPAPAQAAPQPYQQPPAYSPPQPPQSPQPQPPAGNPVPPSPSYGSSDTDGVNIGTEQ